MPSNLSLRIKKALSIVYGRDDKRDAEAQVLSLIEEHRQLRELVTVRANQAFDDLILIEEHRQLRELVERLSLALQKYQSHNRQHNDDEVGLYEFAEPILVTARALLRPRPRPMPQ